VEYFEVFVVVVFVVCDVVDETFYCGDSIERTTGLQKYII